jgi:hypothetical protein
LFYYASYSIHENELASNELIFFIDNKRNVISSGFSWFCDDESPIDQKYSAFTASELEEMLPEEIIDQCCSLMISKNDKYYDVSYCQWAGGEIHETLHETNDENGSNARAKMLIHLLEKGLIKNES